MDPSQVLNIMRDPAGIPASPQLFQLLMVLTWALHIAFVHLALGSSALAIYAFHRRAAGAFWERLSMAMTQVAKISISLLIVLGVAPLLFTQTIYDPQWYASNVLSARWAIIFIFSLIVAYSLWFAFYYANHKGAKRYLGVYAWVAFGLFCMDGLIMHVLSYQALLPGQWMHWYAPDGVVDTSGAALHAIQWPRYLFIMALSVPAIGVFLPAYAHYFSVRPGYDRDYLDFVRSLGSRLALAGYAIAAVLFLAWQAVLPAATGLALHPVGWLVEASLLAMLIWIWRAGRFPNGYAFLAGNAAVLGLLAFWREIIRVHYLLPFNYDISTYKVHADHPSTFLFFATLLGIGCGLGGFYLTLLYRAGRVNGVYTADRTVSWLGTAAVAISVLWTAVFLLYGIVIWLQNSYPLH
jgi:hypothetical protein